MRKRKLSTEELLHNNYIPEYTVKELVTDIIMGAILVVAAFFWMLVMLLIISFVTLSYLHFEIDTMKLASVIFAIVVGVIYIIKKILKQRHLDFLRETISQKKQDKQED